MQVRAWMLLPMLMPTLATTAIATPARTSPKPPPPLSSCAQVSVELPAAMADPDYYVLATQTAESLRTLVGVLKVTQLRASRRRVLEPRLEYGVEPHSNHGVLEPRVCWNAHFAEAP